MTEFKKRNRKPELEESNMNFKETTEIHQKLKRIIKTSNNDIETCFLEFDQDNTGYITNLQFRSALRKLNIALTNHEIDELMIWNKKSDGMINWKEFFNIIKPE